MAGPRRRRIFDKLGFSHSKSRENVILDAPASASPLLETTAPTTSLGPQSLWDNICDRELAAADSDELKAAAHRVREDIRKDKSAFLGVQSDTSPALRICQEILLVARHKQAECNDKRWKIPGHKDVELSHIYGSVAKSVQKFVGVGDVASQIDPLHFGIPWAAVRLALLLITNNHEHDVMVLEGLASSSRLIVRYAAFEEVYLRGTPPVDSDLRLGLESSLEKLYKSLLLFLLNAQMFYSKDAASRFANWGISGDRMKDLLQDVSKNEIEVQSYESSALKQAANKQFLQTRELISQYNDRLRSEERETILNWISTVDYRSPYLDIYKRLMPGTGDWFFDKKEFLQWEKTAASSLLWLRGDAGTGKSSLLAQTINRLGPESLLDEGEVIAYFHCSRISGYDEREDPECITKSLLQQLASPVRGLPIKAPIIKKYRQDKDMGSRGVGLTLDQTENLVVELIRDHYSHVTIVLDALDEIDIRRRARIFRFLKKLVQPQRTVIKLLVSSRNEPDILGYFGGSENLYIEANDNADDIRRYVVREVGNHLLMGQAKEALKAKVEDVLTKKAGGMFRWVELQVAAICDPHYIYCAEDVEEALERLPPTLEATYARTMERLGRSGSTTRVVMETTLKLLICAKDSMDLNTIQEAISICQNDPIEQVTKLQMIRMSQGFIVFDEESRIFRFAHLSVREYLEKDENFSGDAAHAVAAELCLRCLLYGNNYVNEDGSVVAAKNDDTAPKKASLPELYKYALFYWPDHCANAKQRRQSGRLQHLLSRFLGIFGEKSYYMHWIDQSFRSHHWDDRIAEKNISCISRPPHPIFVICTYGFDEVLPQIQRTDLNYLQTENGHGLTPAEVAAYYGHLTTLEQIISSGDRFRKSIASIDNACESAAAGSPSVEVMEYLLSKTGKFNADDDLICAAALNPHCSVRMLEIILAKAPQFITGSSVLCRVVRQCRTVDGLQLLLSRMQTRDLDEETVVAACSNYRCTVDILRLFLEHFGPFELTENSLVKAIEATNWSNYKEIFDLLCPNLRNYSVTSKLLRSAAGCHSDADHVMSVFLPWYESHDIDEDVFRAAVGNSTCGIDVLQMLTDRFRFPMVTEPLLTEAAQNFEKGNEILKVLLGFPERIERPEEAIYRAITRSNFVQPGRIAFLLEEFPTVELTDSLFTTAVSNSFLQPSMLEAILSSPHVVVISELMLERAAFCQTPTIVKILLTNALDRPITEKILLAAVKNYRNGFEILNILFAEPNVAGLGDESILSILEYRDVDVRVVKLLFEKEHIIPTSAHLLAAAYGNGLEALIYLLERCSKNEADFLKSLLQPRSQVRWSELARSVVRALIPHLNEENITEEIWKDIAAKESRQTMEALISRIEPPNYQDLLDVGAGNAKHGYDLTKYLLSLEKVTISNETFLSAARSGDCYYDYHHPNTGARTFRRLFQYCRPLLCCQEIALVAATNRVRGRQIVELMMKNSAHVSVNQELLQASATNPKLLEYLLSQPLDGAIDANEIVKLTANGGSYGINALLILVQSSHSIEITEEVLKAVCVTIEVAGYGRLYRDTMSSVLETVNTLMEHPTATITEDIVKEGVKNHTCALQLVQTLMRCPKNQVSMSQAILELAVQNKKSGYELTKYIFDDYAQNVEVTKELVALASKNCECKHDILELLLNRACIQGGPDLTAQTIASIRDNPHGLRNALFRAAYRGHVAAFKVLIDTGADLKEQHGNVGNVLHVASFAGRLQIVEILAPYASLLDVPGGQFRSPLLAALTRGRVDIAKCLVDAGVDTETVDPMQRTILHRLVRSKASHHTAALLELGASSEARDIQGYTALHFAVMDSSIPVTTTLLNANAPINAKDTFGWTPLHWAARKGNVKMAELLTSAGADLHSSDSQARTPLGVAVFFGQDKLQKILWTGAGAETLDLKQGRNADETKCGACGLDIYGDQYTCDACEDFDLCYRCVVDAALIHDAVHVFRIL